MDFPILYKKTETGKINQWHIWTEGSTIYVEQGQTDGKKQLYEDGIVEGKSVGRANETTPEDQAVKEAEAKWKKKWKKDYYQTIDEAMSVTVKVAKEGGYIPMTAQDFKKHGEKKIIWPAYAQPKLDGLRCIARKDSTSNYDYPVTLWFRSGNQITSMKYIQEQLNLVMEEDEIWDGEMYAHGEDFNEFTGMIRRGDALDPEYQSRISFCVYDAPRIGGLDEEDSFKLRHEVLAKRILSKEYPTYCPNIQYVQTALANNLEEAKQFYQIWLDDTYEGMMIRNIEMPYEQKRSYNLLKYKDFVDDEFEIIGFEEGRGGLMGHIGAFICRLVDGQELKDLNGATKIYVLADDKGSSTREPGTVKAKLKGKKEELKRLFQNPSEFMGKQLTIKYFSLSEIAVPRFPVGKGIRFDK